MSADSNAMTDQTVIPRKAGAMPPVPLAQCSDTLEDTGI